LFGSFLPPAPNPFPLPHHTSHFQAKPVLPFSPILLKRRLSNKEDKPFLLVELYRFLALLPCTSVLHPELIHLYLTSSVLPDHLPILTSVALRFLY
jgi:hypothetical protein